MDQGQCWRWTKRKHCMSSNLVGSTKYPSSSYGDDSWEEQAFAKDAAGVAGSIWPPRSYSCSFCRREFRSAQALGGHMNVHRRDRARLKHPSNSTPQNDEILTLESTSPLVKNPFASLGLLYQSSLCGLGPQTNPNYDPAHLLSSPSQEAMILLYNNSSSIFDGVDKTSKGLDSGNDGDETGGVAVSMNLFVCRNHPPAVQLETDHQEEADISFKKRKTDASSIPLLLFPKSSSVDQHDVESKVFQLSPSFAQELDLELRLGHRSKV